MQLSLALDFANLSALKQHKIRQLLFPVELWNFSIAAHLSNTLPLSEKDRKSNV